MTVTKEKLSTAAQSESTAMSPDAVLAKYINAINHDQFDVDEQLLIYSHNDESPADGEQDCFAFRKCGPRGTCVFPSRHHHET